jgi:hypothetical protein
VPSAEARTSGVDITAIAEDEVAEVVGVVGAGEDEAVVLRDYDMGFEIDRDHSRNICIYQAIPSIGVMAGKNQKDNQNGVLVRFVLLKLPRPN